MEHIKTPVQINNDGVGEYADIDNDSMKFEAVIIIDQDDQICLVPTDLKLEPEKIAAEIVTAINEHAPLIAQRDALVAACEAQKTALEEMRAALLAYGGLSAAKRAVYQGALMKAQAALALVKGEQKSDDATA